MRYRVRAVAIGALALSLVVAGCSKNSGSTGDNGGNQKQQAITIDTKGTTPVPAPEIPGAKPGGTLTWLEDGAIEHTDPGQMYVTDAQSLATLIYRTLTGYIEDPNGGPLKLVGDLATNTGEASNDNKTWTYHLRDGIKFDDGSTITSKDVAYGISRAFGTYGKNGPHYVQLALDPDSKWTPDKGGTAPGITTPDDKTIVFNFPQPHAETPYIMALNTSTPVPQAKDTGAKYEAEFVSMGPYMRDGTYDQQTKLTLKKNPNWDPKTDPIRHQYPDKWVFDYSADRDAQTQRLIADQGADQGALMVSAVAQSSIASVQADPNMMKRIIAGSSTFVDYLTINTSRVTDLKVRQAINYAFDRGAYVTAVGGSAVAAPATTLESPQLPGWAKYDAYPSADGHGDIAKAKELLAGQTPKLTLCEPNTPTYQKYSVIVQQALQRAGFQIVINPIDKTQYYTTIGDKKTTCDLMRYGWSADFPDAEATLDVLFNGEKIVDTGNNNVAYFNEPTINKKLNDLAKQADRAAAATAYAELDKQMMTDYAPVVPNYIIKTFNLRGSKVGGTFLSPILANPNLVDAFYNG